MTNGDEPSYSGADLLAGALAAIDRSRVHAPSIRVTIRRLGQRAASDEDMDARDPDVQALIEMIVRAGIPAPPLLSEAPRGQYRPTADHGNG